MNLFLWFALALFVLTALPCVLYFGAYLATGEDRTREISVRFYRWASLVALATFNISIFKHIILILIDWPR